MAVSVIVLLGPPGSGKGTQAKELAKRNPEWVHVSTGDLFRAEIGSGSELGRSVKGILDSGLLVSDEVTDKVFQSQVRKIIQAQAPRGLLLDGYPRTRAQAESLLAFAKSGGLDLSTPVVIEFKIEKEEIVSRLSDRLINPRSGRIYHRISNPPRVAGVCDDDGGPLIQRPDDQPETIRSRVKLYEGQRDAILAGMGVTAAAAQATALDASESPAHVSAQLIETIEKSVGQQVFNRV